MSYYDYKVVPAPKKARKIKGVTGAADLFALALTDAINDISRQGWEYYCSETFAIETPGGWFTRAKVEEQTVLVFRKSRDHLSPRIAPEETRPAAREPELGRPRAPEVVPPRPAEPRRPEPGLGRTLPSAAPTDTPFRPKLGPAGRD